MWRTGETTDALPAQYTFPARRVRAFRCPAGSCSLRQRRAMFEECLKICNQGNWVSCPHCICIESEAHAQIIITKIPIN